MHLLAGDQLIPLRRPPQSRSARSRSGVEPPTGTIHPREGRGTEDRNQSKDSYLGNAFPDLGLRGDIWLGWSFPLFCRSGVEPPTGMIHPRESRGTADGKHESIKRFTSGTFSGFGIAGGYLAGVDRSGRGFNPRPAQGGELGRRQKIAENVNLADSWYTIRPLLNKGARRASRQIQDRPIPLAARQAGWETRK